MCNQSTIRNYSLLPIGRQTFSHFQASGASSCVMITWEDKHYKPKCPLFLLLPPAFSAERDAMGMEHPSDQLPWSCPFPASHAPPAYYLLGGRSGEKEKVLTLCKLCSAAGETSLCYQHWFSPESTTWHHTGCCGGG